MSAGPRYIEVNNTPHRVEYFGMREAEPAGFPGLDIDAIHRAHTRAVWGQIFTPLELACVLLLTLAILTSPYWLARGPHAEATAPTPFTLAQCTGPALNETTYIIVRNKAGRLKFTCTTVSILGR